MTAGCRARSEESPCSNHTNLLQTPFISSHGTRVSLAALRDDKEYSACGPFHQLVHTKTQSSSSPPERDTYRYWRKVLQDVKHEARSELSISKGDWSRRKEASTNVLDTSPLEQPPACMHTIPRIHINSVTLEQFLNDYEAPKKPVIIQGLLDDWPAREQWKPEKLLQRMPDAALKVGADDEGYPVRMKLKHYFMYITDKDHGELDDSPMYIFDGTFSDKKGSNSLSKVRAIVHAES